MKRLLLAVWALAPALAAAAPEPSVVVVRAARLIDGRGGAPVAPAMVLVEGDRIAGMFGVGQGFTVPDGRPSDRSGRRDAPARAHRPAHAPDRQVRRALGRGPHDDDAARGGALGCEERARHVARRLHDVPRDGADVALRGRRSARRDRAGCGSRPASHGSRQLRLLDRRRGRRAAVLDLRGRADRPEPRRRCGRDHEGRPHELQERRRLHQDPGHRAPCCRRESLPARSSIPRRRSARR